MLDVYKNCFGSNTNTERRFYWLGCTRDVMLFSFWRQFLPKICTAVVNILHSLPTVLVHGTWPVSCICCILHHPETSNHNSALHATLVPLTATTDRQQKQNNKTKKFPSNTQIKT